MGTSSTQAYCWTVADGNHGKPKLAADVLLGLSFPQNENGNKNERTYSYKGADEMIKVGVIAGPDLVLGYATMVQEWQAVCGAAHVVFVNSAGYGVSLPPDPQRFVKLLPAGDRLSGSQKDLDPLEPNQEGKVDKNSGTKLQDIAKKIGGTVWVWPRGGSHKDSYTNPDQTEVVKYTNPEQTWVSSVARENGLIWDVGGGSATLYFEKKELKKLNKGTCGSEASTWKHKLKSDKDSMNDYIANEVDAHNPEEMKTLINERATEFAEKLKALAKQAKCMGAKTVDVYVTGMLREWFYTTDQDQARYEYAKHFIDTVESAINELTADGLTPGTVAFLKHETEAKQEAAEFLRNGQAKNKKTVEALALGYTNAKAS
jgi:hypothetical protein